MSAMATPSTGTAGGTASSAPRRPSREGRGRSVIAAAVALAWLAALTVGAAPAAAATPHYLGAPGAVTYYPANNYTEQVFLTGALYPTPTAAVNVPGPVVGPSAGRAGDQTVRSTTYVQQWNGYDWVLVGTPWSWTHVLPAGSGPVQFAPTQLTTGPGYFKVVIQIIWVDQYGILGATGINYEHASDYVCAFTWCAPGPGYFSIA